MQSIDFFNYNEINENECNIKEKPYKSNKLRKIKENDSEIVIAPNKILAKTLIF